MLNLYENKHGWLCTVFASVITEIPIWHVVVGQNILNIWPANIHSFPPPPPKNWNKSFCCDKHKKIAPRQELAHSLTLTVTRTRTWHVCVLCSSDLLRGRYFPPLCLCIVELPSMFVVSAVRKQSITLTVPTTLPRSHSLLPSCWASILSSS